MKPEIIKRGNVRVRLYARERLNSNGRRYHEIEVRWFDFEGAIIRETRAKPAEARALAIAKAEELAKGNPIAPLHPQDQTRAIAAIRAAAPSRRPTDELCEESVRCRVKLQAAGFGRIEEPFVLERATDELIRLRGAQPAAAEPMTATVAAFIADKKKLKLIQHEHERDLKSRLGAFARRFPQPLPQVATPDILTWIAGLNRSNRTAQNYLGAVQNFYAWAARRNVVPKAMAEAVDALEGWLVQPASKEVWTPEQFVVLLRAAHERKRSRCLIPYLVLGAFAGLRTAELNRLEWPAVDVEGACIEVSGEIAKGRKSKPRPRTVPMMENLCRWIARWGPKGPGLKERVAPHATMRNALRRLAQEAGLRWLRNGLRKSCASYAEHHGSETAAMLARQLGHSRAMAEANYVNRTAKRERAIEWFEIGPEILEQTQPELRLFASGKDRETKSLAENAQ